jgi:protein-disulfide isomerase
MRKVFLLFLLTLALGLAGCMPQVKTTPVAPTNTARPAPTTALSLPAKTAVVLDSGCTVVTQKPTPGPTAESLIPPVSASDWVKGPDNAKVTIIEYSDFQ